MRGSLLASEELLLQRWLSSIGRGVRKHRGQTAGEEVRSVASQLADGCVLLPTVVEGALGKMCGGGDGRTVCR